MSDPMFTVIVPTYERPELLAETIRSVQEQTVDDFECLVVDDASPHPVTVPDDPRLRLLRLSENRGEPAARNAGLAAAHGRYVTFVDDDDLFTPDRLAIALEGLERAPVSVCLRRGMDGSSGGARTLEGNVYDTILDQMTPQLGQVAIKRELAPSFDELFAALTDVDWWLRVAGSAPVSTAPKVGLLYRMHDGPRNRNGLAERVRCSHLLLEKHHDYFRSHPPAQAFRWKRIGLMNQRLGHHLAAREAFVRSLRLRPKASTVAHLARSMRKSTPGGSEPRERGWSGHPERSITGRESG
ncbi:MAG: glycosyltransferase family 2 protein [Actinomycetota bacterium]